MFDNLNSKNNIELGYKHFNGEKILLKNSLRKGTKSPKFFISPKKCISRPNLPTKYFKNSNFNVSHDKASFVSINKDTITKYKYLFSDVDNISSCRNEKKRPTISKNTSYYEDGDFTNLQKFGEVYSTAKSNTSNIFTTETDARALNSTSRRSNLLTDSTKNLKEIKI